MTNSDIQGSKVLFFILFVLFKNKIILKVISFSCSNIQQNFVFVIYFYLDFLWKLYS